MVAGYLLVGVPGFIVGCWLWWIAGAPTLANILGGGGWWYLATPLVGIWLSYQFLDKTFKFTETEGDAYTYNRVRRVARERRDMGID